MGKKYIIELESEPFKQYVGIDEPLYRVKGFNSLVFDMTGIGKLTPYTEPDLEQVRTEAYEDGYKTAKIQCGIQAEKDMREVGKRHYQRGLSDAWEAARKIIKMPEGDLLNIFAECYSAVCTALQVILKYDAPEAIEKLRDYEQEQEEIKVGDEVHAPFGTAVVTNIVDDKIWFCYADGHCGFDYKKDKPRKTGRHFPEIATVLKKMRGEQDG